MRTDIDKDNAEFLTQYAAQIAAVQGYKMPSKSIANYIIREYRKHNESLLTELSIKADNSLKNIEIKDFSD